MNRPPISYYLKDESRLAKISLAEIQSWISKAPYSQPLRILLAKKQQSIDFTALEATVHQGAAIVSDRVLLYRSLHGRRHTDLTVDSVQHHNTSSEVIEDINIESLDLVQDDTQHSEFHDNDDELQPMEDTVNISETNNNPSLDLNESVSQLKSGLSMRKDDMPRFTGEENDRVDEYHEKQIITYIEVNDIVEDRLEHVNEDIMTSAVSIDKMLPDTSMDTDDTSLYDSIVDMVDEDEQLFSSIQNKNINAEESDLADSAALSSGGKSKKKKNKAKKNKSANSTSSIEEFKGEKKKKKKKKITLLSVDRIFDITSKNAPKTKKNKTKTIIFSDAGDNSLDLEKPKEDKKSKKKQKAKKKITLVQYHVPDSPLDASPPVTKIEYEGKASLENYVDWLHEMKIENDEKKKDRKTLKTDNQSDKKKKGKKKTLKHTADTDIEIEKLEAEKSKKKRKTTVKAMKSLKLKEEVVSELWADLLAKQGHIKKANKMYRKLILKYPEKSSYFAAKLKNTKKN